MQHSRLMPHQRPKKWVLLLNQPHFLPSETVRYIVMTKIAQKSENSYWTQTFKQLIDDDKGRLVMGAKDLAQILST
jgi:hypothetical protein